VSTRFSSKRARETALDFTPPQEKKKKKKKNSHAQSSPWGNVNAKKSNDSIAELLFLEGEGVFDQRVKNEVCTGPVDKGKFLKEVCTSPNP